MSEIDLQQSKGMPPSTNSGRASFLWQQLPYLVALVLAIAGVAYTNISRQPLVGYWEFLALAIAVVCVVTKWPELNNKRAQFRLIWTQALHWVAVLATMNIILLSGVQQLLPAPATSLVLLTLLALGTFLAGLSLLSPQISFLGLAMGASVPAISWLQQSVIFFLLAAILLIGLGMTFWLRGDHDRRAVPDNTNDQVEA
ncbi:membrane-associated HD superfamily phosphohydrolase [Nitrobacteraceae bacterium AZCC 2146]